MSSPLRAIIIDDEQKGINTLKVMIGKFTEGVKVVADTKNPLHAVSMIQDYRPDIVFLDINMPQMSGFELLEQLPWRKFALVFITAHHEHALKALKNNAVDFILKPVDHRELLAAVDKAKARIRENTAEVSPEAYAKLLREIKQDTNSRIFINLKTGIEYVETEEIIFLESIKNYTRLYLTSSRVMTTARPMKEFEERLCAPSSHFMRVHKCFLVNLNRIQRYIKRTEEIVTEEGHSIPLSRLKREGFMTWLNV